jgi:hypothetical protein
MNSFTFAEALFNEKMDKMRNEYEAKLQKCHRQLDRMTNNYEQMLFMKTNKIKNENSPQSRSYREYNRKIGEGNEEGPFLIGGSKSQRHYRNVEYHREGKGHHTIRRVHIMGGKGHKSVTTQMGRTRRTLKKALTKDEIEKICNRKFIPGLFDDCVARPKN